MVKKIGCFSSGEDKLIAENGLVFLCLLWGVLFSLFSLWLLCRWLTRLTHWHVICSWRMRWQTVPKQTPWTAAPAAQRPPAWRRWRCGAARPSSSRPHTPLPSSPCCGSPTRRLLPLGWRPSGAMSPPGCLPWPTRSRPMAPCCGTGACPRGRAASRTEMCAVCRAAAWRRWWCRRWRTGRRRSGVPRREPGSACGSARRCSTMDTAPTATFATTSKTGTCTCTASRPGLQDSCHTSALLCRLLHLHCLHFFWKMGRWG